MTWRERAVLALLRRFWPRAFDLLLTALMEEAVHAHDVVVPAEDVARMASEIRAAHREFFPRVVRHGRPVAELIADLRLAKALRETGDDSCPANP